jgi:hypothetical protein
MPDITLAKPDALRCLGTKIDCNGQSPEIFVARRRSIYFHRSNAGAAEVAIAARQTRCIE